jgi:hypothetical protein
MADFFPVISRAIAGLAEQTPQARRAIYDRARQVLVAQLRNVDPPIAESEITRQRLALDDVINRIEQDYLQPDVVSEPLPPVAVQAVDGEPVVPEPAKAEVAASGLSEPARTLRPSFASLLPATGSDANGHSSGETARAAKTLQAEPAALVDRPRLDIAPTPPSRAGSKRKLIVLGGVALGLAAVGTAAFYVNRDNRVPQVASSPPQPAQPQTQGGPKINERVGGEPSSVPAPAPPTQPPAVGAPGTPSRGELAVAQRAVLYLEPQDTTQPPRAIIGRVSWRVEAQNTGQGQLLETIVRADVDIAEVGLQLAFTLRRNTDAAFPASHILGMRFQRSSDDGNGAVREAGVPQFKQEESERGAPLSAITTTLGENLFVSALSRVPIEVERNTDLIRTRNWVDIPVRFASGKRGIVAFEKGLSGDQRLAEGFAAWR